MKFLFLLISLFSICFATAVGFVEFEIPSNDWEMLHRFESESGTTIIYVPKEPSAEFFGANYNLLPSDLNDVEGIRKSLNSLFPTNLIHLQVIEKDDTSSLVEWTLSESKTNVGFGLSRIFVKDGATVVLTYYSEKSIHKEFWLVLLQQAKILYTPS